MKWKILSSAPHRLYFLAGTVQAILSIFWWLCNLSGIFPEVQWAVASIWAHAFLMMYGFFPFLIFGFLMTAAPNWINGKKVDRAHYVPAFLVMATSIAAFYPALSIGRSALAICVSLYLAGWLASSLALLHIVVASDAPDKIHAYIVIGNVFVGWIGGIAYLLWLLTGNALWLHASLTMGAWLFLLPIFLSVSHRMIPFFSSMVLPNYVPRRPYSVLFALLAGMMLHAAIDMADESQFLWVADFPMAIAAFYLSMLWKIRRSFQIRLLAMLHIAFAWLGLALALYAVQSFIHFMSHHPVLGMAPLHALAIGYFSSMAIAMITRVTLGHSGRNLKADRTVWFLFLAFQLSAVFRILGDFPLKYASVFYMVAAFIWLVCFSTWNYMHISMYWQPRIDGKPG